MNKMRETTLIKMMVFLIIFFNILNVVYSIDAARRVNLKVKDMDDSNAIGICTLINDGAIIDGVYDRVLANAVAAKIKSFIEENKLVLNPKGIWDQFIFGNEFIGCPFLAPCTKFVADNGLKISNKLNTLPDKMFTIDGNDKATPIISDLFKKETPPSLDTQFCTFVLDGLIGKTAAEAEIHIKSKFAISLTGNGEFMKENYFVNVLENGKQVSMEGSGIIATLRDAKKKACSDHVITLFKNILKSQPGGKVSCPLFKTCDTEFKPTICNVNRRFNGNGLEPCI